MSLSNELFLGTVRWDLLAAFPQQEEGDRRVGGEAVAEFTRFLHERVDPTGTDLSRELPKGVVEELRARGCLRLMVASEDGGRGLSPYNTFRLIETAASWSLPVANVMGIGNGFGAGAYLRMPLDGPLREVLRDHVAAGNVSGRADTEPAGAGNSRQTTVATPLASGGGYRLNGEKVFIGNAVIADLLDVTATLHTVEGPRSVSFFVDTTTPGLEVVGQQDFMGLRGAPIGHVRLTDVEVPASRMLGGAELGRLAREVKEFIYLARTLSVVPPSLAIARLCLEWSREFTGRRTIDGRPLGAFPEIQRIIALSMADTYAAESLVRWTLLSQDTDPLHEHAMLKNVASETCWRVLERTMGLLGGEGYETADSKARRGARPLPLERFHRDARGLRISGGVDYLVDLLAGQLRLTDCYYARTYRQAPAGNAAEAGQRLAAILGGVNAGHVEYVTAQAAALAWACQTLTDRHPDQADGFQQQHTVLTLHRIAAELLTMSTALARSAAEDTTGASGTRELVDIHCAAARHRLTGFWEELDDGYDEQYADVAGRWLAGRGHEELLGDVITTVPRTGRGAHRRQGVSL
ncbi:acyl-CoA dehydrogenase family protein [Streptomyces phaeolivaceus]|uniref:acyl-CoA dehydrogenase family protein n=1 Tax=Streptomyces phaeolivaceus TaxID=2653200 RepID=UPI0018699763|nr:acyl-CoA dehydrogenase [Streptomyces phaeolivaceus]